MRQQKKPRPRSRRRALGVVADAVGSPSAAHWPSICRHSNCFLYGTYPSTMDEKPTVRKGKRTRRSYEALPVVISCHEYHDVLKIERTHVAACLDGYLSNRAGISDHERLLSRTSLSELLSSTIVLVKAHTSRNVIALPSRPSDDITTASVRDLGQNAYGVSVVDVVRGTLLWLHVRSMHRLHGHARDLVKCAVHFVPKTLSACAPSCQSWDATLFYLKFGFLCSEDLILSRMRPGGHTPSKGSTMLTYMYDKEEGRVSRVSIMVGFLERVILAQKKRTDEDSRAFVTDLEQVRMHWISKAEE